MHVSECYKFHSMNADLRRCFIAACFDIVFHYILIAWYIHIDVLGLSCFRTEFHSIKNHCTHGVACRHLIHYPPYVVMAGEAS